MSHHHLQEQLKQLLQKRGSASIALKYGKGHSNTTRSKSYKKNALYLHCGSMDRILHIDLERMTVFVEPRVTMEALFKSTFPLGLCVPVLPEFKGITVGGAIMGAAAESSSHRHGIFSDVCISFELLLGDGSLIRATPTENREIFHAIPGSYGSLGVLVTAELQLVSIQEFITLRTHAFKDAFEALQKMQNLMHSSDTPEFLDGIVFSKDLAVIVEGSFEKKNALKRWTSKSLSAPFYFHHVKEHATSSGTFEERMHIEDYLFRYDQGAFWMGAYLFHLPLLARFITQGIFRAFQAERFDRNEIERFHKISFPFLLSRLVSRPLMNSQRLWSLLHKAEKWVNDRFIIQDFCLPETRVSDFLHEVLEGTGVFPLWLCPIKGTKESQLFAPHYHPFEKHFINVGVYGLPSDCSPIDQLTRKLERRTRELEGRKVLYSRSYYTPEEFWDIYPKKDYQRLREETGADGVWKDIDMKVLSS